MAAKDQETIQQTFRISHSLHRNRPVALCVTIDGLDAISLLQAVEEKRPSSKKPFKLRIPEHALPQVGVYSASEFWEIDQESPVPQKEPKYKPTSEDLLSRYTKGLIYKTIGLAPRKMALALGCFLHTYRSSEIALLSPHFDHENIRRNKAEIKSAIQERFKQFPYSSNKSQAFNMRVPNEFERAFLLDALHIFAPWIGTHAIAENRAISIYEQLFAEESAKSDWEMNHLLVDPLCGGLPRLIQEYNKYHRESDKMLLDDPYSKLAIPDFIKDFTKENDRFNPPPLNQSEIELLKCALNRNKSRRTRYSIGRMRVCSNGQERLRLRASENVSLPYTITSSDSHIQVFGEDREGDILLAVFPILDLDSIGKGQCRELSITHQGAVTIKCLIEAVESKNGKTEWQIRIAQTVPFKLFSLLPAARHPLFASFHSLPRLLIARATVFALALIICLLQLTHSDYKLVTLHSFTFASAKIGKNGKITKIEGLTNDEFNEYIGNGVKLEMVKIRGGNFKMGSLDSEIERDSDSENPQHSVDVTSFLIDKYEVTQAQWKVVMADLPEQLLYQDDLPVTNITWDEAQRFCIRLSALTSRKYRLPSEAEWEYAARAGTTSTFAFGDAISPEIVNYDENKHSASETKGLSTKTIMKAGSFKVANAWGLYDMHGNVWEWVEDVWHQNYVDAPQDGSAWMRGGIQSERVIRGGSYMDAAIDIRSAKRNRASSQKSSPFVGFRVVTSDQKAKSSQRVRQQHSIASTDITGHWRKQASRPPIFSGLSWGMATILRWTQTWVALGHCQEPKPFISSELAKEFEDLRRGKPKKIGRYRKRLLPVHLGEGPPVIT